MKKSVLFLGLNLFFLNSSIFAAPSSSMNVQINITNKTADITLGSFPAINAQSDGSILTGSTNGTMTVFAYGGTQIDVSVQATTGSGSDPLALTDIITVQATGGSLRTVKSSGSSGYAGSQPLYTFNGITSQNNTVTVTYNGSLDRQSATLVTNLTFTATVP